jgi:cytochrome c oxidase cbb3-type subunit 1
MPVHWNAQLYGWLALPLVGLLLRVYRAEATAGRLARLAVAAWSATLLVGCASWLAGRTGGKPFLEWTGEARWLLTGCFLFLEGTLAVAFLRGRWGRLGTLARAVTLLGLATIPVAMWMATSPRVYPPINPDSGGPTGTSLLGSTLGIVWLFVLTPAVLGLQSATRDSVTRDPATGDPAPRSLLLGPAGTGTASLAALHTGAFLLLEAFQGGNRSHHEALQVLALASLTPWPFLLWRHLRRFRFAPGSAPWLAALGGWGSLLVATAFVTFLPGVLERWKFTNALVAHAHLAMAGMVTSFSCLVLIALARRGAVRRVLGAPIPFAVWQLGCLAYVASMMLLGTLEGIDPGMVIRSDPVSVGLYGFRWVAGAMMLGASAYWLVAAHRRMLSADALAEGAAGTSAGDRPTAAAEAVAERMSDREAA